MQTQKLKQMKNKNLESRFMPFAPSLEVREKEDGKKVIRGYALKFNVLSRMLYGFFKEKIDPRALDNTDLSDVVSTLNHNMDKLLGRSVDNKGTLTLQRDKEGLFYEVDPPKTATGDETLELISRGDISGSSFVFDLNDRGDSWTKDKEGVEIRTLLDIRRVYELGPVVNPAYIQTEASVAKRSLEAWHDEQKPPEPKPSAEVRHAIYQAEALKLEHNL